MAAQLTRRPDVERRPDPALQPRFVELALNVVCVCDGVDCVLVRDSVLVGARCPCDRHQTESTTQAYVVQCITWLVDPASSAFKQLVKPPMRRIPPAATKPSAPGSAAIGVRSLSHDM